MSLTHPAHSFSCNIEATLRRKLYSARTLRNTVNAMLVKDVINLLRHHVLRRIYSSVRMLVKSRPSWSPRIGTAWYEGVFRYFLQKSRRSRSSFGILLKLSPHVGYWHSPDQPPLTGAGHTRVWLPAWQRRVIHCSRHPVYKGAGRKNSQLRKLTIASQAASPHTYQIC